MSFEEKVQELNLKYQAAIQEAALNNDTDKVNQLVLEMQSEIEALAETSFTPENVSGAENEVTGLSVVDDSPIFHSQFSDMDLDGIVFPKDKEYKLKYSKDGAFHELAEKMAQHHIGEGRRYLLAHGMRLTPGTSKMLYSLVDKAKEILSFKADLEVFVLNDPSIMAGIYPFDGERFSLFFSSALLEKFNEEELLFVLGHELGHAICDHTSVPLQTFINSQKGYVSLKQILELHSWQRAREYSADRIGLLCSNDFSASCSAFFKFSSGLTTGAFSFSVDDYVNQFSDLANYIKSASPENVNEMYTSHPLSPIRVKALDLFKHSDVFMKNTGSASEKAKPLEDIEKEILKFTQLIEPEYLSKDDDVSSLIKEFIFLAGFMVSKSDGKVDEIEVQQLSNLLGDKNTGDRITEIMNQKDEEVIASIQKVIKQLEVHLNYNDRLNIARDIFSIATCDNIITQSEVNELEKVCRVLGVPKFLGELLAQASKSAEQKKAA